MGNLFKIAVRNLWRYKRRTLLTASLITMGAKVGDTVVIVATNQDGSVNGKKFKVAGVLESATGPGGRDGYVHLEDAMEILRLEELEVSEVAIRLKDFDQLHPFTGKMERLVKSMGGPKSPVRYEVHSWEKLSPFFTIAKMINLLTFFIKLMLIAIVLISIMNVMIMAVYERKSIMWKRSRRPRGRWCCS